LNMKIIENSISELWKRISEVKTAIEEQQFEIA
jgi:hypothetical protein